MNSLEIAISALKEIIRLHQRSNKHDHHTCYQMYRTAQRALKNPAIMLETAPVYPAPEETK